MIEDEHVEIKNVHSIKALMTIINKLRISNLEDDIGIKNEIENSIKSINISLNKFE